MASAPESVPMTVEATVETTTVDGLALREIVKLAERQAGRAPVYTIGEADDPRALVFVVDKHVQTIDGGAIVQQEVKVVDLDDYRDTPRTRDGEAVLVEAGSFLDYVARYQDDEQTTIWLDEPTARFVAVLDGHGIDVDGAEGAPRYHGTYGAGNHRAALQLHRSPQWKAWLALDHQLTDQETFAEFVEFNASDIAEPDPATFLEIALTLQGRTDVDWKSVRRLTDGSVQLRYEETTSTTAGQVGDLFIPQSFTIRVPIFVGTDPVDVVAKFRYRVAGGKVKLGYVLTRPSEIEKAALDQLRGEIASATGLPVLAGTP